MAITRGNVSAVGLYDVAGGTVTLAVTAGQGVVAWVSAFASSSIGSVFSDSDGNTWAKAAPTGERRQNDATIALYYVLKVKNTLTITITCSDFGGFQNFGAVAYHPGSGKEFALDAAFISDVGVGTTSSAGSLAAAADSVILVGSTWETHGGTPTSGSGYAIVSYNNDYNNYMPGGLEDQVISSASSYATGMTVPSAAWASGAFSLKAVAAGGSTYNETVSLAASSALTEANARALAQSVSLGSIGALTPTNLRALSQAVSLAASGALTPTAAMVIARAVTLGLGAGMVAGDSGTDAIESVSGTREDQQTGTLSFGAFVPPIGWQVTAFMSLFAMDPTAGMFSDNNGHTYSSPDVLTEVGMSGGDSEDGILATVSTIVTANGTAPFVISFDSGVTTPGDVPGRWWTWAAICHPAAAKPNVIATDEEADSNAAHATEIPKVAGALSVVTPSGDWIAFFLAMNRGHDTRPVNLPLGWTVDVNNSEDSLKQSGHCCHITGSGVQTLEPQATVTDIATGLPAETTGYRCAVIVYEVTAGSASYDETVSLAVASGLSGAGSQVISAGISLASVGGVSDGATQALIQSVALGASAALSPAVVSTLFGSVSLSAQVALSPAGALVLALSQSLAAGVDLTTSSTIGAATYALTVALATVAGLSPVSQQSHGAQIAMDLRSDIVATSQQITNALISLGVTAAEAEQAGVAMQASLTLGVIGVLQASGSITDAPVIEALRFASLALSSPMFTNVQISGPMFTDVALGPE